MIRPSSLPMLAECSKFEGAPSENTDKGLARHRAIAAFLKGEESAFAQFEEEERDNLVWAADYIKMAAPIKDHPLVIEKPRKATLPNGMVITGTPDFTCGPVLLDLKWRYRDYGPQMACYAWMLMDEGFPEPVNAHLLFAEPQSTRVLEFTAESAWAMIKPILENATAPFAVATPCTFCGWCAKKLKCEALIQQVNIALKSNPEWDLPQWHSSEMKTAKEMGQALKIARTLSDWCESVEFHAKEMAVKQGKVPEGFELKSRQGNRYIADLPGAFQAVSLPQAEFLKACSVKPRALFDLYAEFHGMKKAPAEREVEKKLGSIMQRKEPSQMLVQAKPSKD